MSSENKSLSSISWEVPESTYRADPALSYSTLSKYEREGFNNLEHLFDKLETPSLTFGSAVDTLITGNEEEFQKNFMVAEFPSVPDSIIKIVKSLFNTYGVTLTYKSLREIPDSIIIKETEHQGYQLNWKPETRAKVIREKGDEYYKLLFLAGNRTILDTNTYEDICNTVEALRTSESTHFYFTPNNPFDPSIERFYQLKFKETLDGIDYRCMADLLVVNHEEKFVIPCDLKTSSSPEWDFHKSFIKWRYDIQARLYWRIIRAIMDKDEYFKYFALLSWRFIVVNRKTLTPLVWEWESVARGGTIKVGKDNQIELRDPQDIGKELNTYLTTNPKVPAGITEKLPNNLDNWLLNML